MRRSAESRCRALCPLLSAPALLLLLAPQVGAQVEVVIRGVVEDAVSRAPVAGARVLSADSSSIVLTDSLGAFAIEIESGAPLVVHVDRFGYMPRQFSLSEDARSASAILLLHPAAIELERVDALAEGATARVHRDLRNRRNAYWGPVRAFESAALQRFGGGSVWEFVRLRTPTIFECSGARSRLCARPRSRTSFISSYNEGVSVLVCVDGWESWGAVGELSTLNLRDVELVEIFNHGRGGIRVYTSAFFLTAARKGRNVLNGLGWPC